MTNPVTGSGVGSLPLGQSVQTRPMALSSAVETSNASPETLVSPAAQATASATTTVAATENSLSPAATVDLSVRGQAAVALMRGADQVAKGYSSAALDTLATQISQGIYNPPPQSVADALIAYELRFLKGS